MSSSVHFGRVFAATVVYAGLVSAGCCKVPASVKLYAADLPARADGQYGLIDDEEVKKSLVMKDAMLGCKIDVEEGKTEEESPACQCAKSSSPVWTQDCKGWLGTHTPAAPGPAPNAAPATGPAPGAVPAPGPAPTAVPNG